MRDEGMFHQIVDTVKRLRSVRAAVTALQHNEITAETYAGLHESTVRLWFEPHTFHAEEGGDGPIQEGEGRGRWGGRRALPGGAL